MKDLIEKVKRGLKCCFYGKCSDCPYNIRTCIKCTSSLSANALMVINQLEENTPKNGKWSIPDEKYVYPICSECGKKAIMEYSFCPFCGADMREVEGNG